MWMHTQIMQTHSQYIYGTHKYILKDFILLWTFKYFDILCAQTMERLTVIHAMLNLWKQNWLFGNRFWYTDICNLWSEIYSNEHFDFG